MKSSDLIDREDALNFIMSFSNQSLLNNEYSELKHIISENKLNESKDVIMINFLFQKIKEIDKEIELSHRINNKGYTPYAETNVTNLQNLKKQTLVKLYELIAINTHQEIDENITRYLFDQTDNVITNFNYYIEEQITYEFSINYEHGCESHTQKLTIQLNSTDDFNDFLYKLKEKLGIFINAKFDIILYNIESFDEEFLENLKQLSKVNVNFIKIISK